MPLGEFNVCWLLYPLRLFSSVYLNNLSVNVFSIVYINSLHGDSVGNSTTWP
jgi:hypothetical protein